MPFKHGGLMVARVVVTPTRSGMRRRFTVTDGVARAYFHSYEEDLGLAMEQVYSKMLKSTGYLRGDIPRFEEAVERANNPKVGRHSRMTGRVRPMTASEMLLHYQKRRDKLK